MLRFLFDYDLQFLLEFLITNNLTICLFVLKIYYEKWQQQYQYTTGNTYFLVNPRIKYIHVNEYKFS